MDTSQCEWFVYLEIPFSQTHTNKCNWVFSLPDHLHHNHASDVLTQFIREDERSHFFN